MTAACADCGTRFTAAGHWQKRCWPCWRATKDRERTDVYVDGWDDGYAAAVREGAAYPAIPPDLLRDAIALCHPDRHPAERADTANRVTAALLALWQAGRRAA